MNIKEIFKHFTYDTYTERLYDKDGCEVGTMQRFENGIIFEIKDLVTFYDEYQIEMYLDTETAEELINWIND